MAVDRVWGRVHRLADGTEVTVRMLRPDDRAAFLAGFARLSPESRYLRFFTAMPRLRESTLRRLLDTDGTDHVALAAWHGACGAAPELLGVARFIRLDAGDTAEAAVVVVDHMQRRGVGTVLLEDLCEAARERGIRRFHAEVMRGNRAAARLLRELDAHAEPVARDGDVAIYELDVPSAPAGRPGESLLFRMLRLVARGLEVGIAHRGAKRQARTGTTRYERAFRKETNDGTSTHEASATSPSRGGRRSKGHPAAHAFREADPDLAPPRGAEDRSGRA